MAINSNGFTYLMRVRYGECDAQGVVFNARYADYADLAATEFMRAVWGGYEKILEHGVDTQVVNLNISWKAPAKFDDVLALNVQVSHIGNSSFALKTAMVDYASERLIAIAEVVYVVVTPPAYTKTPIPDTMRQTLTAPLPDTVVNHAGIPLENLL